MLDDGKNAYLIFWRGNLCIRNNKPFFHLCLTMLQHQLRTPNCRVLDMRSGMLPRWPHASTQIASLLHCARLQIQCQNAVARQGLTTKASASPRLLQPLMRQKKSQTWSSNMGKMRTESTNSQLDRTGLYDLHVANGGKMVPFAGYSMPVQYSDLSHAESHKWTREKVSLFDVGHMVQHHLSGPGAAAFLERVTPASTNALGVNSSTLSCFLHPETGGIVDDTVIARLGPELFYIVTNAACKDKDLSYLKQQMDIMKKDLPPFSWNILEGQGLVALQGPLSREVLEETLREIKCDQDFSNIFFGQSKSIDLPSSQGSNQSMLVSRAGYTGEDGFEISVPPQTTKHFTETLLKVGGPDRVRLAGLGARDSLRLEAGMCLYGHDLNDDTTPVEGGLSWVIHKDRRTDGGFHGSNVILEQLKSVKSVKRRRVGLLIKGAPAREGASIVSENGENVGNVTSGCPSPTMGKNIAMGYVKNGLHKAGTELKVLVRNKPQSAEVVKMPFVPSRYWKQALGTAPA